MGLDNAYHHLNAILLETAGLKQHLICLADAGGIAQIYLELASLGPADHPQKFISSFISHNDSPFEN